MSKNPSWTPLAQASGPTIAGPLPFRSKKLVWFKFSGSWSQKYKDSFDQPNSKWCVLPNYEVITVPTFSSRPFLATALAAWRYGPDWARTSDPALIKRML